MEEQIIYQLEGFEDSCFSIDELAETNSQSNAQNAICTIKSEFDSCPSKYTKQNYQDLINTFGTSIINLFKAIDNLEVHGEGGIEVPAFMGTATIAKDPAMDMAIMQYTKYGIYIAQEAGQYSKFNIIVSNSDFSNNYCILYPQYNPDFIGYTLIKVPFPTIESAKIGEDIKVALNDNKTFGKYINGSVIPCAEWSPEKLLKEMAQEYAVTFRAETPEFAYSANTIASTNIIYTNNSKETGFATLTDEKGNILISDIEVVNGKAKFTYTADIANGTSTDIFINFNGQVNKLILSRDSVPEEYPVDVRFQTASYGWLGSIPKPIINIDIKQLTIPETECDLKDYTIFRNNTVMQVGVSITKAGVITFTDTNISSFKEDQVYKIVIKDQANNSKTYTITYKMQVPVFYVNAEVFSSSILSTASRALHDQPIQFTFDEDKYSFLFIPKYDVVKQIIMDNELDCTRAFVLESNTVIYSGITYNIYRSYAKGAFDNNIITIKYNE